MKLSNKEGKYRSKIIAENHLKKDGQRYLDQYIKNKSLKYKTLYVNYEALHVMLAGCGLYKLRNAMKDVGTSFVKSANAFQRFSESAARLATTIQ